MGRGVFLADDIVDHRLDGFLAAGEGIEFRLCKNESLIGPAGRHDLANEGDMKIAPCGHGAIGVSVCPLLDGVDEIEVTVHLLIFDQGAAENDLRNEDDRNNENAGLTLRYERGDEQADGCAACRSEEHGYKNNPKPILERQEGIADPSEKRALDQCEKGEGQNFC